MSLRDQVIRLRPERRLAGAARDRVGPAQHGQVVRQRVDPDEDRVLGIAGDRETPPDGLLQPRNREIAQAALDERAHLVAARLRLDGRRRLRVPLEQLRRVLRKSKEVVLLLDPLDRRPVNLADLLAVLGVDVVLGLRRLAADAVHAVVVGLVDVAGVSQPLPHLGDCRLVARLGRADEVVVRDLGARPGRLELLGNLVAVRLRLHSLLACDALDLLAVLVEAGQEEDVLCRIPALRFSARAVVARQRVVDHGRIERPEVRDRVHIVDGRRDVEAGHRAGGY